jgi:hypothetical protein
MTGTDELPERDDDDDCHVIETDQTLNDYVQNLRMHDETKVLLVTEGDPLSIYQITGHTGHLILVNLCPFGDHDDAEDEAQQVLIAKGWRRFAVALNAEDEWSVEHYEPAREARPLEWRPV